MHHKQISKPLFSSCLGVLLLVGCEKDCTTSERCQLKPEAGPCYASIPRYYYDQAEKRCKSFVWGGCTGVVPFETMEQCQACECRKNG